MAILKAAPQAAAGLAAAGMIPLLVGLLTKGDEAALAGPAMWVFRGVRGLRVIFILKWRGAGGTRHVGVGKDGRFSFYLFRAICTPFFIPCDFHLFIPYTVYWRHLAS